LTCVSKVCLSKIYKKRVLRFWQIDPLYKHGHWHCGYPFMIWHLPPFKQLRLHWFTAWMNEKFQLNQKIIILDQTQFKPVYDQKILVPCI